MKGIVERTLGDAWAMLPPVLRAHYGASNTMIGHMDIEFPSFMKPLLVVLHAMGALVDRAGGGVATVVERRADGDHETWRRTITYADGNARHFDSVWVAEGADQAIEYVNSWLGLQMAPRVEGRRLHIDGVRFVLKLGPALLTIPEWLALGHTTIIEEALDEHHFAMDFRLTHPLFGQLFRYAGQFEVVVGVPAGHRNDRPRPGG